GSAQPGSSRPAFPVLACPNCSTPHGPTGLVNRLDRLKAGDAADTQKQSLPYLVRGPFDVRPAFSSPCKCRSITLCRYSYQGKVIAKSLTEAENRNLLQNRTIVLLDRFPAREVGIFFRRYRPWLPTVRPGALKPAQEN